MKFLTLSTIIIGLIIIFNLAGVDTPTSGLVEPFLDGGLAGFKQSIFWTTFVTILTVGVGGGAIAGLFGRAPPESYLIATLVFLFGGAILTDAIFLYTTLWGLSKGWMRAVISLIFIPFILAFFQSMISYWRGADG